MSKTSGPPFLPFLFLPPSRPAPYLPILTIAQRMLRTIPRVPANGAPWCGPRIGLFPLFPSFFSLPSLPFLSYGLPTRLSEAERVYAEGGSTWPARYARKGERLFSPPSFPSLSLPFAVPLRGTCFSGAAQTDEGDYDGEHPRRSKRNALPLPSPPSLFFFLPRSPRILFEREYARAVEALKQVARSGSRRCPASLPFFFSSLPFRSCSTEREERDCSAFKAEESSALFSFFLFARQDQ